jgi:hypothetical protein
MGFRRSISQAELRAKMTAEQLEKHGTTFQASRGGHYPEPEKPVPGTPKKGRRG